jgi:subtilisin family serine protease
LLVASTIIEKSDPAYFRKKELGDDPYVITTTNYGNSNTFPDTSHGTECSGIIAALRNNTIGGNGISNSVEIMPVRIQPVYRSDEQDKDVANAIRYAVDNGAQVINMSFGKFISPFKSWVDEAVKYAGKKGVLLIASAGNDATNTDSLVFYPNTFYTDKTFVSNLIKVGASTFDSTLVGNFSNYGKNTVSVFAPGDSIYTTKINKEYLVNSGTSFAAPVVAGLAALIWSYYPTFTYKQIRYCIEQSAISIKTMVSKPGTKEKVPFSSLCKTGGIVNAYQALLIAEQINKPSWKRKHKDEIR